MQIPRIQPAKLQPPVVWLREAKGIAVAAQLVSSRTDTPMQVFWGAVE